MSSPIKYSWAGNDTLDIIKQMEQEAQDIVNAPLLEDDIAGKFAKWEKYRSFLVTLAGLQYCSIGMTTYSDRWHYDGSSRYVRYNMYTDQMESTNGTHPDDLENITLAMVPYALIDVTKYLRSNLKQYPESINISMNNAAILLPTLKIRLPMYALKNCVLEQVKKELYARIKIADPAIITHTQSMPESKFDDVSKLV